MNIFFFWKGSILPPHGILSLKSFLYYGHQCDLYCYEEISNIPEGVKIKDASIVVPWDDSFLIRSGFGTGSPAPFSDWFRFNLLLLRGGVWSDLDVICLKPWNDLPKRFVATSLEIPEGPLPNINVIRLDSNDEIARLYIDLWKFERDPCDYASGVKLMNKAIEIAANKPILMAPKVFNPISYRNAKYLISKPEHGYHPESIKRFLVRAEEIGLPLSSETYGLHLWSEMWKANGWNQDKRYPANTVYGSLQNQYL